MGSSAITQSKIATAHLSRCQNQGISVLAISALPRNQPAAAEKNSGAQEDQQHEEHPDCGPLPKAEGTEAAGDRLHDREQQPAAGPSLTFNKAGFAEQPRQIENLERPEQRVHRD